MKPSAKHFLRYDAQTFERDGFIQVSGDVHRLAQSPRFWKINVTVRTRDPETGETEKRIIGFKTEERAKLSELSHLINDHIHQEDDFLQECVSVMVVARVVM